MSYSCSRCEVNWSPDQADHGRCPMCGGDTVCTEELPSEDAELLYRITRAEAHNRDVYANFDRHHAGREQDRPAA